MRDVFQQIQTTPTLYTVVRMALVRRFPYVILYRVEATRIVVVSVFHTSRDPKIWRRRL